MKGLSASKSVLLAAGLILLSGGCMDREWVPVEGSEDALKSSASFRAERRLYDGAPPVIGHGEFGVDCSACHDSRGISVDGVGYAPASPHDDTDDADTTVRCRQCHVFANTTSLFVESEFEGFRQDLRTGSRLYPGAPPTIPHKILMRENCAACHTGPAARAEILTSHPERTRCRQCHVPVTTREVFLSSTGEDMEGREES
jgi:cytochrome c-type protein NapB